MEKAKQVGSSRSSITMDLFGPKGSTNPSSTLFHSIFDQPNTLPRKEASPADFGISMEPKDVTEKGNVMKKDKYSNYCNSSIYYGDREVYSPADGSRNLKRDGGENYENESNISCASRGNWWEGSLYY